MTQQKNLPSFEKPPLTEVVFDIYFARPSGFNSLSLGKVYKRFQTDFPTYLEKNPLGSQNIEFFGSSEGRPSEVSLEIGAPYPRVWFMLIYVGAKMLNTLS